MIANFMAIPGILYPAYGFILTILLAGFDHACHAGELGGLLEAALENPSVSAMRANAASASDLILAAQSEYFGQLSVNAGVQRYDGEHVVGYYAPGTTPAPLLARTISVGSIGYVLPLDIFGQISSNVAKTEGNAKVAGIEVRRQQLAKLHQTLDDYCTLYALMRRREAMVAYRSWVEATVRRIEEEARLGRSAQVDVRYAESQLASLKSEEQRLSGDIASAQANLAEATGRKGFIPVAMTVSIPAWRQDAPEASLTTQSALANEETARAAETQAESNLLPHASLNAGYSYNAGSSGDGRENWAYGANLTWTLDGTSRHQADAAKARVIAAQETTRSVIRESGAEIAGLYAQYESDKAQIDSLVRQISYDEEIVKVEREMQRLGRQTLENLFMHEDNLLQARTDYALAQARAALAWSGMQVIMGTDPKTYIKTVDASGGATGHEE
jgi:outer membrane protein TolC